MAIQRYVVEFIGTFFLVLTIGLSVLGGVVPAPLAIAAALTVMIYSGGHLSGAHFNPAVTVAVFLRGKLKAADVIPYWAAQLIGATLAAFTVTFLLGKTGQNTPIAASLPQALLAEFLFTFALAWVILNVATAKGNAGNSFYGIAIGLTVLTGAFTVGGLTGGAFNPAVALGAALMKLIPLSQIWIHIVADTAGGIVAALAFKALAFDAD
jgi:aquaporin Z